MNELTKRREALESRFVHEEAMRFKAIARAKQACGLWAAQRLGKSGADAEADANTAVIADLEEPGDEDLIRKIVSDLNAAGVPSQEDQLRRVLEEFVVRAAAEIKAGA